MMDKVQEKKIVSICYTPSSKPCGVENPQAVLEMNVPNLKPFEGLQLVLIGCQYANRSITGNCRLFL
jgi:hypothetical protein